MSRRVLLVAGATAVVVVAVWALVLWMPQGREVSDAQAREETAESSNTELELQLARLRSLEERRPSLDAEAEELANAVPAEPRLGEFLLDVDEAAVRAGVSVTSVTPTEPADEVAGEAGSATTPGATGIPVAIETEGGYFEVLDYINRLEDLPRVVVVDGVTLTSVEDESGETMLTASLTTRIFMAGEPDDTAATGTTTPEADGGATSSTTTSTTTAPPAGGAT